ncbi:MAG: YceI family protein [Saprospirales bacterium]|nr:MAG: YceI family protein [Saprospirales bacterium]
MMKYLLILGMAVTLLGIELKAQDIYFSREGRISFFSEAPLEDIEAHNNRGSTVYNASTGEMEFSVLIRGFIFEKSLMQEHFNENFMESHLHPRANFVGKIRDHEKIDFTTDGEYPFVVEGEMEIRSIKQPVVAEGKFVIKEGGIMGESVFELTVADFDITIPAVVRDNIARVVEVRVRANYSKLER